MYWNACTSFLVIVHLLLRTLAPEDMISVILGDWRDTDAGLSENRKGFAQLYNKSFLSDDQMVAGVFCLECIEYRNMM